MACKRTPADKWFSVYIRLRDIISGEYCRCITCGKPLQWKYEAECGHFQSRGKPMTRFDEKNCHAQCNKCNNNSDRGRKGEQYRHGKEIDKLYGDGTADNLEALGNIRGQKIHTKLSIKDLAKTYRLKAKELAKEKGIDL